MKARVALVGLVMAGGLITGAMMASPASATPTTATPTSVTPVRASAPILATCNLTVRIFSKPDNSTGPRGVCFSGDVVAVHGTATGPEMDCGSPLWDNITDTANGVTGWISDCNVTHNSARA